MIPGHNLTNAVVFSKESPQPSILGRLVHVLAQVFWCYVTVIAQKVQKRRVRGVDSQSVIIPGHVHQYSVLFRKEPPQ